MSFLVAAALAVGLLVAVPLAAHLLRRGRAQKHEFPPTALVPTRAPTARRRSRLEDRLVLLLRIALVTALALLGATPLVRCSRLSLVREAGGSLALALVIDDSLSMRARTVSGDSRWALAVAGARQLLDSAQEGDAVAVVLAGHPARLALAPTTDLEAVRRTLGELHPTDRGTDLADGVQLARSALEALPHTDQRVVVLSDLADDPLPEGDPPAWVPLAAVRRPAPNCGIQAAERVARQVLVRVACSTPSAARAREVIVREAPHDGSTNTADASPATRVEEQRVGLSASSGVQTLRLEVAATTTPLVARITGEDAIDRDDEATVAPEAKGLEVAVVVDPARAAVSTGGATLPEQALEALARGTTVRPLPLLPDEKQALEAYSAILLDDPEGVAAEARVALTSWIEQGGVALALLGPAAESASLGSSLEPFATGSVRWQAPTEAQGIAGGGITWLGEEAASLGQLAAKGRAELEGAIPTGATIVGRWDDGRPWLLERPMGRGVILTAGLPASAQISDLAVLPGFLALLDHVLAVAAQRAGPVRGLAGTSWWFPRDLAVQIRGPEGPVTLSDESPSADDRSPQAGGRRVAVAELHGRYQVRVGEEVQERFVGLDETEIVRQPQPMPESPSKSSQGRTEGRVDASAELALVVLSLFGGEWLLRLLGRRRRRRG